MSVEVLQTRFESYTDECSSDRRDLKSEIDKLKLMVEGRVSFKHFYWIIGTLIGIQTAIFGGAFWLINSQMAVLNEQVLEVSRVTSSVQGDVSFLKGKLSPYDVQYSK